ncbi:hypothetical protein LMH87_009406 [Akanthomyces muscarius]|uniref:Uncharacterized protein n=1 Tax=Akanthomyces muscarius TaxID=2231603 RepID=A0A9W8QDV0_AKAMU|nr:hypothetical protein LMH87_009406 [Akanthomyces muscarius]KAJ4152886.1 hypothetical protein LMH87_009406 [Akanthomyces muscarius]
MHRITPNTSTYHSALGDPPATETATAVTLKRKSSTLSMTPPENTKSNRRNRRGLLETDYSKYITEEESRGEDRALRKVDRRDLHICVISGRKGSLENVSILPNSVNPDSAQLSILRMLLGEEFQVRIRGLLEHLNWRDEDWNIFTLNGHLSSMYELGLIGFRPTKIVPCVDENGCRAIRVYFELHFLGPTETNLSLETFPASYASLGEMCTLQGDYKNNMSRYTEFDATTGERITDGAEFSIRHPNRRYAENMFACLALSWTARMVLFLAGGAGNAVVDLDVFHRKETLSAVVDVVGYALARIEEGRETRKRDQAMLSRKTQRDKAALYSSKSEPNCGRHFITLGLKKKTNSKSLLPSIAGRINVIAGRGSGLIQPSRT